MGSANVNTLHPGEFKKRAVDNDTTTGRMCILSSLSNADNFDIIGIQEARLPVSGRLSTIDYTIVSSAATASGNNGSRRRR